MEENFLHLLTNELGDIISHAEECPGVYYLCCISPAEEIAREYYVVLGEDVPISQEVRAMGRRLETVPALVYLIDSEEGPRWAVHYEILRYKTMHNLPLPDGESLREIAVCGAEMCTDYFGAFPVPLSTPWGYTLRHRALDNGIYWLETDQCINVLAICHPVWSSELSEGLLRIAGRLDHEDEFGYVFFQRESACVALWELLRTRPELVDFGLIRKAELMNTIWEHHPEYAMGWNAQEQAGLNDGLELVLYALGVEDRKLEGSVEYMITITPETGTDFIGFWN